MRTPVCNNSVRVVVGGECFVRMERRYPLVTKIDSMHEPDVIISLNCFLTRPDIETSQPDVKIIAGGDYNFNVWLRSFHFGLSIIYTQPETQSDV